MHFLRRFLTRSTAFAHDFLMVPVAWLGAFWLRFNFEPVPGPFLQEGLMTLPFVLVLQTLLFWRFGLYRGVWRFASLPDLIRIIKAVVTGTLLVGATLFLFTRLSYIPRSVMPLYALFLVGLLSGPRLLYRWMKDQGLGGQGASRALIVGAGRAGEMLVRDLLRDPQADYLPVAFVDDERNRRGRDVHGVTVRGTCDDIPALVHSLAVDVVLIAIPSASSREMRRIVDISERTGVAVRTLPQYQQLLSGKVTLNALREVSIEDLLGREPISLDWASIAEHVRGRVVMVTGGGGSIGAELCRQVAKLRPAELVILDSSEYNLFEVDRELRQVYPGLVLRSRLGDICDREAVNHLMQAFGPHLVFHAAAYKHVPMLEEQAREAARNNVLGTWNVARAAIAARVETFVLISTDKAVNPVNVMGASKRAAEMVCQSFDRRGATRFVTVRFGNVLGSTGSVVPLFREQIENGGPVTVTHQDIERYFMTIPEACQLILQAAVLGQGGEIFVLDMGEPVKIRFLAEQMILLSGKLPGEDIDIVYTGLRPGEKLYEELFYTEEQLVGTGHDKLLLARVAPVEGTAVLRALERLQAACDVYDEAAAAARLRDFVPDFDQREQAPAAKVVSLAAVRRSSAETVAPP